MLERVAQTCKEMLEQRGYVITEEDETEITGVDCDGNYISVFILDLAKVNVSTVVSLLSLLNSKNVTRCIIVYRDEITSKAKYVLSCSEEITIELFKECEVSINITKHSYVPKHELVERDDKDYKLLRKISPKLPRLLQTDPVARFYGYKPKDIIKVTRKDGSIEYRVVCAV